MLDAKDGKVADVEADEIGSTRLEVLDTEVDKVAGVEADELGSRLQAPPASPPPCRLATPATHLRFRVPASMLLYATRGPPGTLG